MNPTCPHCRNTLDTQINVRVIGRKNPKPGDVAYCSRCVGLSIFTDDGSLREPSEEEMLEILANPDVKHILVQRATSFFERILGRK